MQIISAMPTNLYVPNDDYHPENSHVAPALLRRYRVAVKLRDASEVVIWGSGRPRREFLHLDDLADACEFPTGVWDDDSSINIGGCDEVTIAELAPVIARVVGWTGRLVFDASKPKGTPRKLLDSRRLSALGWTPSICLRADLAQV